jgi:cytochrome c oxidase assembly protein subunit 15
MTLEEFKVIFWWEYIHRLLGRLIGLFYIIPLIYITLKKVLNIKKLFSLYLIFFLICLQGFVGWYMVQSGLTERTDVSQYRLSLHLTLAFTIFSLLIWNFLDYKNINNSHNNIKIPFLLPIIFFFLLILQISLGAFVSGLDAGTIYQTWPLMEGCYFPNDSNYVDLFTKFFFDTPSLVQFMHRNIAYLLFLTFLIIFILVIKNKKYFYYRKTIFLIFAALVIQIILGIITVLSGAAIIWASLHQIGSILLTTASIVFLYKNYKIN